MAYEEEMSGHTDMMCQCFMAIGRLEAKLDMLLKEEKEDEATETFAPTPASSAFLGAMADPVYDSSTATYDGMPKTGTYNGGL